MITFFGTISFNFLAQLASIFRQHIFDNGYVSCFLFFYLLSFIFLCLSSFLCALFEQINEEQQYISSPTLFCCVHLLNKKKYINKTSHFLLSSLTFISSSFSHLIYLTIKFVINFHLLRIYKINQW